MANRSIPKRPVVFTWAEIQKYPTLEARYTETLPFKHHHNWDTCWCGSSELCSCECGCNSCVQRMEQLVKCIKRTGERWAWFSAARDLDDKRGERLGTLGYLPWEIRQKILVFTLQTNWSWTWPNRQDVQMSDFGSSDLIKYLTRWGYHDIGLASPSTKVEFEHCYLTNTIFTFGHPKVLEGFLDSLSTYQQSLLRSFEIDLYRDSWYNSDTSGWLRSCNRLPSNLSSIKFDVPIRKSLIKEPGEKWFIRDEGLAFSLFKLKIECLNSIGKQARRRAPRAKIGFVEGCVVPEDRTQDGMQWFPVLDELEPWSKDWLEWWEEDTKVDLNKGERAGNKA